MAIATLLKLATDAHGGLGRWNQLKSLKAHLSVTGGIWHVKGRPDVLKDIRIELSLREQLLTTHLLGQNKRFRLQAAACRRRRQTRTANSEAR
jgi:hypothetical protein